MRRACAFCGNVAIVDTMKRLYVRSRNTNFILTALLSLMGVLKKESVGAIVDEISKNHIYICHSHVVKAAQYLCAELAAFGKRISFCDDPSTGRSKAYITTADVPPYLVEVINGMAHANSMITGRDVWLFLNDALKKYHGSALWPQHYEEEELEEEGAEGSENAAEVEIFANPVPQGRTDDVEMEEEDYENEDETPYVAAEDPEYQPSGSESDCSFLGTTEHLGQTDEADKQKYFLVKGEKLLKLFRFCPECGHQLGSTQLRAVGTAAVVRFVCGNCSVRYPPVKRWESQDRAVAHSRERKFRGNVVAAVSAITTGLRYTDLARWAEQAKVALFSKTFYVEVFKWTKPAVEKVYRSQQELVLERIVRRNKGEALNLAADGAYDSRGYSAMICKVVLSDLRTNLILHTEVLHRSETENVSTRMEVEGLRRLLRWVCGQGLRVSSVTTDRSRSLGAAIRELEPELGAIQHYYDGWHLVKWLGNQLRQAAKVDGCGDIAEWTEKVKSYLWTAIKRGAASGVTGPMFNSCLMHIRGVHQWPLDDLTGPFTSCSHEPLEGPRPEEFEEDSKVYGKFRDIILTKSFQRDLAKAGPHGGTSLCEAKHSLDRIYCPKEKFYPIETYPLYAKMATMHMNTLWLAEDSGERRVLKRREVQRKYLNRKSVLVLKSPAKHVWRDFVLDEVLKGRLRALQEKGPTRTPQWVVDLMEAEEDYEWEL